MVFLVETGDLNIVMPGDIEKLKANLQTPESPPAYCSKFSNQTRSN